MKDYSVDSTYRIIRNPRELEIDDPIFAYLLTGPEHCFIHSKWDGKSKTIKVQLLNGEVVDASVDELFAILIESKHLKHLQYYSLFWGIFTVL